MKQLPTFRIELIKHEFKSLEVKAEDIETAKEIALLKVPEGFDILYSGETTDSLFNRTMQEIRDKLNQNKK